MAIPKPYSMPFLADVFVAEPPRKAWVVICKIDGIGSSEEALEPQHTHQVDSPRWPYDLINSSVTRKLFSSLEIRFQTKFS